MKRLTALLLALSLLLSLAPTVAEDGFDLDSLMREIETEEQAKRFVQALALLPEGTALYSDDALSSLFGTLNAASQAWIVERTPAEDPADDLLLAAVAVEGSVELLYCLAGEAEPLAAEEICAPGEGTLVPGTEVWLKDADIEQTGLPDGVPDIDEDEIPDFTDEMQEVEQDEKAAIRILSQPASQTVALNETVMLVVIATSVKDYQWQWTKDGKTWNNCTGGGYNTDTMEFKMTTVFSGRKYRCKLTGFDSSVVYTSAVPIYVAITVNTQPKSQAVKVGAKVNLSVDAIGVKSYQWQWTADGKTWKNNTGAGYNTNTFSFTMSETFHGRKYRCQLTGFDGTVRNTSAATIKAAPNVVTQPQSQAVEIGGKVTLTVKATGIQAYQWQWTKDGKTWNNCSSSGYNKASFSFTMSAVVNGRQYRCKLTGLDGSTLYTSSATITAGNGAVITTHPKTQSVKVGAKVTFTVAGTGIKSYQWQWTKDGKTWNNNTGEGYNTATFSFNMAETFHGRKYRCAVTGADGKTVYSNAATLSAAATIKTHPKTQSAKVGATLTLTVTAQAVKAYQWQWTKDGKTWTNNTSTGYNKASFAFTMTEALSGRQYRCAVTGLDGKVAYTNAATVSAAATIKTQPAAQSVAVASTVTFSVTALAVKSYQWQFTADGKTWNNNTGTGYNKASFSFKMTQAFNGRKYRCKLVGLDGKTVYTNAAALTIAGNGAVITTHPKTQSVKVGAKVTFTVAGTGIKSYQWQWTKDGKTWNNNTGEGYNTATFSFNMAETFHGRKYRCAVTGADGKTVYSNAATLSAAATIKTHPKTQSAKVGATLTLTVTAQAVKAYQWQWTKDGKTWTNNTSTGYNKASFAFTMTEALSGRQYRCAVTGLDGKVAYSNAATVSAAATIKTQPAAQTVAAGATATFSVTAQAVKSYQWQFTADGKTWKNNTGTGYNKASFSFTMNAAFSGRQYRCALTGLDGKVVYTSAAKLTLKDDDSLIDLTYSLDDSYESADGYSGTITVQATGSWSLASSADWLVVVPSSGEAGKTTVSLTARRNLTSAARTAAVTGTCGSATAQLRFSQKKSVCRALLIAQTQVPDCSPSASYHTDNVNISAVLAKVNGGAYAGHITAKEQRTSSQIISDISAAYSGAQAGDMSFFYMGTHGVDGNYNGSDVEGALGCSDGSLLYLKNLANALSSANPNNSVIVVISACGSGAAVKGEGKKLSLTARQIASAFAACDPGITVGEEVYDENGVLIKRRDMCRNKFYVLTAADLYESSWYLSDSNPLGSFTGLALSDALDFSDGYMYGDLNNSGTMTFNELYSYVYTFCYELSENTSTRQNVQRYPSSSDYVVFWN